MARQWQLRTRVEPPFRVIKRRFGYLRTRCRGLAKNRAQLLTLFALGNLFIVRGKRWHAPEPALRRCARPFGPADTAKPPVPLADAPLPDSPGPEIGEAGAVVQAILNC